MHSCPIGPVGGQGTGWDVEGQTFRGSDIQTCSVGLVRLRRRPLKAEIHGFKSRTECWVKLRRKTFRKRQEKQVRRSGCP